MTFQDWYHISMSKTLLDVPTKEYRVKYKGKANRDHWATKDEVFIIYFIRTSSFPMREGADSISHFIQCKFIGTYAI